MSIQKIMIVWFLVVSGFGRISAQQDNAYDQLMLLSNVLNHIKSNYADEKSYADLIRSAIRGVLSELDPFTTYMEGAEYSQFNAMMEGKIYGVGIEFEIIDQYPTVISVIQGGPSDRKSIRTGDILVAIDSQRTSGLKENELHSSLSDRKDSKVRLKFFNPSLKKEYGVDVQRRVVASSTVEETMVDSKIGYIKIAYFSATSDEEFTKAVRSLQKEGMQYLVVDLRNNPGGRVKSAVGIADIFIPENQLLLEMKGRKEDFNQKEISTKGKKLNCPTAVLVNRGSASAAEILAGILQDYDRALLIGTNTFGKSFVQTSFNLSNGGVLNMTIGKNYLPSGRTLQRNYKGKTLREFYREIYNTDSLRKNTPARFVTKKGKPVHGDIGLMPDIFLEDSESKILIELEQDNGLFKYVTTYINRNDAKLKSYKTVFEFQDHFPVTAAMINDLAAAIKTGNPDFTIEAADTVAVGEAVKEGIAEIYWGKNKGSVVRLNADSVFMKAKEALMKNE